MKVLLIDADSKIPNLALMKLSAFYKSGGFEVTLLRLYLPYYPNKKKKTANIDTSGYVRCFCSVIFEGNKEHVVGDNIIFGGTGCEDITTKLSPEIEAMHPDYSIYPENDISYGFLTRGCIRNCYFCKVPKKEGYIRKDTRITEIIKHKKVKFLDNNNILAHPEHKEMLETLIFLDVKCQFLQGLDIRLIDKENSELLRDLNTFGDIIFAFDDIKYRELIGEKLKLLAWRKDWQLKFYVYVHPDMPVVDTIKRVEFLKQQKLLPFIMRDISCWASENSEFYTDLAAWCNQPGFFKKLTFREFMIKRTKNVKRIENSLLCYETSQLKTPP